MWDLSASFHMFCAEYNVILHKYMYRFYLCYNHIVSDCCLTTTQQFYSYVMAGTS